MAVSQNNVFVAAICKAIGVKHARKLSIIFEVNQVTRVEVEMYAEDLTIITSKFEFSATPVDELKLPTEG